LRSSATGIILTAIGVNGYSRKEGYLQKGTSMISAMGRKLIISMNINSMNVEIIWVIIYQSNGV
jgi:hypothetical protein